MSLIFYSEEGENQKEESIDKYKDLFDEYKSQSITLTEALIHMYTSSGVEKNKMNVLITDLIKDCKNKIELNLDKIKEKYPSLTEDEAIIISSYTCEAEDNDYSPYKLLNKNLVSDDRINGIKKISKYFYILLKSLRKLKKYYPTKENKYLYRCIGVKVNYKIDPFDKKSVPYIEGNTKTFWSFTSTSTCIKTSYKFLKGKKIQSGTIFTLYGDIWGYDISLFNVFNEEEILLEPERKFIVDQVYPPVNDIIHVRCNIQKTNPVLSTETTLDKIIQILAQNNNNIDFRKIFKELFISEHFVDIKGTMAFLPGSQVDLRLVKDITPLLNIPQPFKLIKMDKMRNNIVVSRRAVLEAERNEVRNDVISKLQEGAVLDGVVKNLMEYGAFVDIGGIDGLLHVTDMSWKRVLNPADIVSVGDNIKVQVLKFNKETGRISLGMKQLVDSPWENIEQRYKVGEKYKGKVSNITDYGAFIALEECIEGLAYITELSWFKNTQPSKILTLGQEVEAMVLEINPEKRKIALGLKQCQPNPWKDFAEKHPVGTKLEGEPQ